MANDLQRLAPAVDLDAARRAFERRRRRSRAIRRSVTGVAAVVVLAAGTVGVLTMGEDDAPVETGPITSIPTPTGPVTFEVLAVAEPTEASDPMGTLRAATNESDVEEVWRHADPGSDPPEVDFDDQVVVSITIPDDACPPELTDFQRDGDVVTPVFVETAEVCVKPLIPKTFVVAIDRSSLGASFTLRLPADPTYGYDEQRLEVVLDPSEITHGNLPRVWVMPKGDCCEQAGLGGVLQYDADIDCFFLFDHDRAVVWPTGSVGTADGPGVVLPDGQIARPGDAVGGGGSTRDRADADDLGIAPECATEGIATLQADVFVTPEGWGRVDGTFLASGGPFGTADTPMSGTITATSSEGDTTTVAASGGQFRVALAPGTYTFSGVSPQYQATDATCRATAPVDVIAGAATEVVVGCPRK